MISSDGNEQKLSLNVVIHEREPNNRTLCRCEWRQLEIITANPVGIFDEDLERDAV